MFIAGTAMVRFLNSDDAAPDFADEGANARGYARFLGRWHQSRRGWWLRRRAFLKAMKL
jgi:hypothetical protein